VGAVFVDWLNANEQRNYPLHDRADRTAIDGRMLPNDILVDAHIWLPRTAGRKVFVSSAGVSPSLITLTFSAAPSDPFCGTAVPPFAFTPLAVLRVSRPHIAFKNYDLEPLYPGVGGWVALGSCDNLDGFSMSFQGPANTVLIDRTVHAFNDIPVVSAGKAGVLPKLTGTVWLKGVEGQTRTFATEKIINGVRRRVAAIGLDKTNELADNLALFAGDCGHRPEAENCLLHPLVEINGLKPDCNGNLNLRFEGDVVVGALDPGGLILDHPVGFSQVCNAIPGFSPLPGEDHRDFCDFEEPPEPSSSSVPSSSESFSSEVSSSSGPDIPENCEYFAGPVGPFTSYNQYTVIRPTPPSDPFEWSIELVSGSYQAATPVGYAGEQYMLNQQRYLTLAPGVLRHLSARVRMLSQQRNALLLFGHAGASIGFYFFGISLLRTIAYPNGKFFVGARGVNEELTDPDKTLGYGYVFDPVLEPSGKIWDPGYELNDTEYFVRLRLSRSSFNTVVEAWVDWVDGTGTPRSFYSTIPAFIPKPVEGYPGFGAVSSDTLYNAVGVDCIV
jgi:hypothetical protein